MSPQTRSGFIPADAIDAIRTLHHVTIDRMLGLWVELDQVVRVLDAYVQPGSVPPRLLDAIDAIIANPEAIPDDEWDPAFIELREARAALTPSDTPKEPT